MAIRNLGRVGFVAQGQFDPSKTYKRLDCVTLDGIMYAARVDVPSGVEVTNEAFWQKIIDTSIAIDEINGILSGTVESAQQINSDLSDTIGAAGQKNTELEGTIENAQLADATLKETIESAQTSDEELKQTIEDSGDANMTLETTIENSETANTNLTDSISTASALKTGLDESVVQANSINEELKETFATSDFELRVASLENDVNFLHPLTIDSFSVKVNGTSSNMAEKGSTVTSEVFSFSVNRFKTQMKLNGEVVTGNSATLSETLTENKTYTLEATLDGTRKTASATVQFVTPVYYGISSSYELSNQTVLSLTKALATSRSRTFSVTAGSGQYILYAIPKAYGTPVFKVGGFEGGFTNVGDFDFTNASNYTEAYSLYRSVNAGLGSTSVTVS